MEKASDRTIVRLVVATALVAAVIASGACDSVNKVLGLAFSADSCAEFRFFRNDTLLIKDLEIGTARADVQTNQANCRVQNWDFEVNESWMNYGLDEFDVVCNKFDAEIHVGNQYWEVTTGERLTAGPLFAEGNWKLHEVKNNVDKIIDAGSFEFEFHDAGSCP